MLKCRLSVDECLVHWLDNGMQGNAVELRAGRNLLTPFVQIEVEGKSLNPYAVTDDDFGILAQGILVNLGLDSDYSYANGRNRIRYLLKRREMSLVLKLCLVILCALIVGVLGLVLIPDAVRGGIQDSLLAPLYATFEPFATGNTLQIIFGAVVIGIALLYLGRQTRAIALGIEQVNTLVQFLM